MQFPASGAAGHLVMAYGSEAVWGFRRVVLSPIHAVLAINPIWLHGWAIASLGPFDAVVGAVFYPHVIRQIRWPGECCALVREQARSHKDCAVPVGAGLLAKAASQATQKQLSYSSLLLPRNLNKSRRCFLLGLPSVLTPSAPALRMAAAASRLAILASVSA